MLVWSARQGPSFCRETRFVQEGRVNRRRERPIHHGATAWRCQEISGGGTASSPLNPSEPSGAVKRGETTTVGPGPRRDGRRPSLGGSRGPGMACAQERRRL